MVPLGQAIHPSTVRAAGCGPATALIIRVARSLLPLPPHRSLHITTIGRHDAHGNGELQPDGTFAPGDTAPVAAAAGLQTLW